MTVKLIATNRKAAFNFHLLEKIEAGLVLLGSEVKSCRDGRANISDAYAIIKGGELWLINAHISPYTHASLLNHKPKRDRKLLVHKQELKRLTGKLNEKGLTLVPTKIYFNDKGRAKVELALAKGKKNFDKRESIKKRDTARELRRAIKNR